MGAKYVTRHVFDSNHRLVACRLKRKDYSDDLNNIGVNSPNLSKNLLTGESKVKDEKTGLLKTFPIKWPIIGGICIRPFYDQDSIFAELVFLAVHNAHQHRNVGRKLMRVMKQAAIYEKIERFYTYADNKAIGFFTKLGFRTKNVTKHTQKEKFWTFIKHYDGSELMESVLIENLNYIHFDDILTHQQNYILEYCHKKRNEIKLMENETTNDNKNETENEREDSNESTMRRSKRLAQPKKSRINAGLGLQNAITLNGSDSNYNNSNNINNNSNNINNKNSMQLNDSIFGTNNDTLGMKNSESIKQIEMSLKYGQAKLLIDSEKRDDRFKPKHSPLPQFLV